MRLALRILRPHSLTLTVSLSLSLSHLSHFSHLSHLSHLFLISLISLSSLSLSPLCLSSFRLSSFSSLAGGSGQRATYKGLFTPASKKSAVFFPTSLPSTFPFWSASFRPPPWPQVGKDLGQPLPSTTGLPEGDSMSVVGMLALSYVFYQTLQTPQLRPYIHTQITGLL